MWSGRDGRTASGDGRLGSGARVGARASGAEDTLSHPAGAEISVLSWTAEPAVLGSVLAGAVLYLRGWRVLRHRMPERFGAGRPLAFGLGLAGVLVALASPIDALGDRLLLAHMVQHLLLMVVAPPLLWMGAPVAPLLLGLPRPARRRVAATLARRPVRRATVVLTDPRAGWLAFVTVFWMWHVPGLYGLALRSDSWHHVEHACFFTTAMLFWRPVILPWPARSPWPRWAMIPYLVLADLQASVLAAIFTFSDRVIYSAYAAAPRLGTLTALEDQAIAGVIMWIPGSLAFLLPVVWLMATALVTPGTAPRALHGPGRDR